MKPSAYFLFGLITFAGMAHAFDRTAPSASQNEKANMTPSYMQSREQGNPPKTALDDPEWNVPASYITENRPLQQISKLAVNGAVDVVFRRSSTPTFYVAGETAEAVASVKTHYEGDRLIIEREGSTFNFSGGSVTINGSGNVVVNGTRVGSAQQGHAADSKSTTTVISQGKVIVGLGLPEAPSISLQGSGDIGLIDLKQHALAVSIKGSGNVTASGTATSLSVDVAGSGDVDARDLITTNASLSIAGSGDIEAFVRSSVHARVAGSGDIVVLGNPQQRDHSVAGSGKVKFR